MCSNSRGGNSSRACSNSSEDHLACAAMRDTSPKVILSELASGGQGHPHGHLGRAAVAPGVSEAIRKEPVGILQFLRLRAGTGTPGASSGEPSDGASGAAN